MNYRHLYHAGNFADVVKHIVLVSAWTTSRRRTGGLCVIDAHSGAGVYDLGSEEAAKTGEWERGIGRLQSIQDAPADLRLYLDLVAKDLGAGRYPGSPLLLARHLRPQDRLIANELHEPTFEALRRALSPFKNARATQMDAYECVRAQLPPEGAARPCADRSALRKEERVRDADRPDAAMEEALGDGRFLLWYPIKAHLPVTALKEAARNLGLPRTWSVGSAYPAARTAPIR